MITAASEQVEFWQSLGLTLAWAAFVLVAAAFALTRLWRDREEEEDKEGWQERWRKFLHGSRASRHHLAQSWLELNPFVWMAGRDRQPATLGWMLVSGIVLVWLLCWAAWPAYWPSLQNFFITATLLNSLLAWLTRHIAAQEIAQPRRDGTYELLLTTPLAPSNIVWGTLQAIRGHFRPLVGFVLVLDLLMMVGGLFSVRWNGGSLTVYLIIWLVLLTWTWSIGRWHTGLVRVMWASLNCGRPAHAVWRSSGLNTWSWIWILFNLQFLGRQIRQFPTGSVSELIIVSCLAFGLSAAWLGRLYADRNVHVQELKWDPRTATWLNNRDHAPGKLGMRLITEFREIVREPLPDPTDPRFKRWNVRERFPWGWQIAQHQLHERLARR